MRKYRTVINLLLFASFGFVSANVFAETNNLDLIPRPVRLTEKSGEMQVTPATKILYTEGTADAADYLAEQLSRTFNQPITATLTEKTEPVNGAILFTTTDADPKLGEEGYTLDVTPKSIVIRAPKAGGAFYGAVTLLQLMPPVASLRPAMVECQLGGQPTKTPEEIWNRPNLNQPKTVDSLTVPCVSIWDQPRFAWRGLLADPARFFYTIDELKCFADYMAMHKLNRLQLHLSDHEGFRMEIKRYPKLVSVGAQNVGYKKTLNRPYPQTPGKPKGYYYTQEELKDLVDYAAKRNITIVPEIEMPGHAGALCASYPELLCTPPESGTYENQREVCPGKDSTFEFLQNVLDEVMEVFPGPYIHIGGDECTRRNWAQCSDCKKRMQDENLKNFVDLHGYFIQRIDDYVRSRGRRLVGWDEILESGAKQGAIGMYWRSGRADKIVENAAKEGQSLVISPTRFCYFDYVQSTDKKNEPYPMSYQVISIERALSFEPIPDYLRPEEYHIVLGAQANLWGEMLLSFPHAMYMTWPRACALAEVAWSPKEGKNYKDFYQRLTRTHLKRLDAAGINYRQPREADQPK